MNNLKVVFFGTPEFINPIREVLKENFSVVAEITHPDQLNDQSFDQLTKLQPDLFVVAAYGKIIPQQILDIPKFGAINIHPSLLPKYRGASPIQQAILEGDEISGVTIMLMDDKMDHGDILFQQEFEFSQQDNFDTLSKRMFQFASQKLTDTITGYINGSIKPIQQDHTQATFCKLIKKEDGFFEIDPPADGPPSVEILDRMIRAYYPWPTAWTKWNNKIVKFLPNPSSVIPVKTGIQKTEEAWIPDQVRDDNRFLIQIEGKKPTDLKSFLNGYPIFPLKNF